MRFLKSRLPAVIILTILLIIMGGALITARLYSQDSGLYWTPSSLISGEYSIDDGPWIETDLYTPDGDHVRFERSKSKEVFAYLVHRHGSSCTTRELFAGAVNAYETEYMSQYPWADFLYNGY